MVSKIDKFCLNTAKSLLGRNVNLHLKDGSVIINVLLAEIQRDDYERNAFVKCVPYRARSPIKIPLKSVEWAEMLNLTFMSD